MPYWQLFYHFVWSTKDRLPLLTEAVEPVVHGWLVSKAVGLGATVFVLNGVADHAHLVVAVPPRLALATFIGQVKAVASTKFNKSGLSPTPLFWQDEYGVFSTDARRLPNHIAYVERQKEHHAAGTVIPILERTDGAAPTLMKESRGAYEIDDEAWQKELEGL